MKKFLFRLVLALVVLILVVVGGVQFLFSREQARIYQAPSFSIHDEVAKADVELGHRLYAVRNGCVHCHGVDLAGAKVMENPAMGTVYGANLTPANLKDWSDEEIARAIRYGIHKSGRSLQFMPSHDYQGLAKSDVAALVAYLKSMPAVDKPSPINKFGPVAKTLSVLGKMPVMFPAKFIDQTRGFDEKPAEGPSAEFGKYLAGSCMGCHGTAFRGGKIAGGDPSWPAASDIRLGMNPKWTEESFRQAMKTGMSPVTGNKIRPPMPVAMLAQMNDDELKALWLFLSSLH